MDYDYTNRFDFENPVGGIVSQADGSVWFGSATGGGTGGIVISNVFKSIIGGKLVGIKFTSAGGYEVSSAYLLPARLQECRLKLAINGGNGAIPNVYKVTRTGLAVNVNNTAEVMLQGGQLFECDMEVQSLYISDVEIVCDAKPAGVYFPFGNVNFSIDLFFKL